MTPFRRWCVVAAIVVVVVAVPVVVRAWPVSDSDVSASALLTRVQQAEGHPYSGYLETTGTLQLPSSDRFTDVGALFGDQQQMRVWYDGPDAWRVDRLDTAGESDLIHQGDLTTSYDYADARATTSRDPEIRLPRASDLTPPALGHTVLEGVTDDDVTRLPSKRVAGVAAPGLRITPASSHSSVDHVDLWADPRSGVPLEVEVYGEGSSTAAFDTAFRSFSSSTPAAALTQYHRTVDTSGGYESVLDIAQAADQYAPVRPPDVVAGLRRQAGEQGAAGVYGTGLTRFLAVPLRGRDADPLRTSLAATPGAVAGPILSPTTPDGRTLRLQGTTASTGPLGVLVTGSDGDDGWLVVGTVDRATLEAAGDDLLAGSTYVGDPR